MDPALQELASVAGGEEIEAIIKLGNSGEVPPHVRVVTSFGNVATCRLPGNRIEEVWAHPNCLSLKAARLLEYDGELQLDEEEETDDVELRGTDLRRPEGIGATGRDVVIGVVDWGVDVAHPNFLRPDGRTRFLAVWDQRDGPNDSAPQPYGYGRLLTGEAIDAALELKDPYEALGYHPEEGDPLRNGAHGTHVLDIAAGNGAAPASPMGLAPEAELVFVHLSAGRLSGLANLGDSVRILEAIDFIQRMADDKPWVINTSLGRHSGGHRGLTLVEQGMDAMLMQAPGRAIVQSCGNYYLARAHASGRLLPGRRRILTWQTGRADVTPNELEIWYPTGDRFHVAVSAPVGNGQFRAGLGEIIPIVIAGEEVGRIYHRKRDPTGENHIDIFLRPGAPSGDWQVELSAIDAVDGRFDAYVERDPGCPDCQSRFHPDDFEPRRTLGSICNGFHTIAVGAYDHHDSDRVLGAFSSSGPTRDGRQRPNLVAPGISVLAGRSAARTNQTVPLITRKTGTSMAAPHVTGAIALMFEVAPHRLSIRETHQILLSTTDRRDGDADLQLRIGTGYLNIARAVEAGLGDVDFFTRRDERGTEMNNHTRETRFNEPGPVLVEDADEQVPKSDAELEVDRTTPIRGNDGEASALHKSECTCGFAEATELPDEPWVDTQEFEAFDERCLNGSDFETFNEPWVSVEEIKSRVPTPEELVDRVASVLASADVGSVLGSEAVNSPALLFDSLVCDLVPGLCKNLETNFGVVALPGESLKEPPRQGDMVVVRALGEGNLAFAEVLLEECPESGIDLEARVVPLDAASSHPEMRRLTDGLGRLDESTMILRPLCGNLAEQTGPRRRRRRRPVQRFDFPPMRIDVPVTTTPRTGPSAGEEAVEHALDQLKNAIDAYWSNFRDGLSSFETDMSFASDQEGRSRLFQTALKEIGKALLKQAIDRAFKNFPVLGPIASTLKDIAFAWHAELERASQARGERRIADYVNEIRNSIGLIPNGPQYTMKNAVDAARPAIFTEFRRVVAQTGISQGEHGVLTGEAALFVRKLRQQVSRFKSHTPSAARFQQLFTERFAGDQRLTRLISHGGRSGGTLYLKMHIVREQAGDVMNWTIKNKDSAWTLATTAPRPGHLATSLMRSLQRQGKSMWRTGLPKMVEMRIETEIPWALNRYQRGFVRFTDDAQRFSIRSNYGPGHFRAAWRIPTVRRVALAVDRIIGSDR